MLRRQAQLDKSIKLYNFIALNRNCTVSFDIMVYIYHQRFVPEIARKLHAEIIYDVYIMYWVCDDHAVVTAQSFRPIHCSSM